MSDDPAGAVGDALAQTIGRYASVASAEAVVGPAREEQGRIAIPLAAVSAGYGMGMGMGYRTAEEGAATDGEAGGGGGGGGGGGAKARPVAVIELSESELRVHQVVDSTRITIASLALAAWTIYWVTRTVRAFRRR